MSKTFDPCPLEMNKGVIFTDLKARTGLLTPPGSLCWARENNFVDCVICMKVALVVKKGFSRVINFVV